VATISHCLSYPLLFLFVISASSFFPSCLQIFCKDGGTTFCKDGGTTFCKDGGTTFLRQLRVCIPNIPFLLRARSRKIDRKIVDTFQVEYILSKMRCMYNFTVRKLYEYCNKLFKESIFGDTDCR